MNSNEIKKDLECCVKGRFSSRWNCTNKECPYYFKELFCVQECKASALAYINQLEAEVERLNTENRILSQKRFNIFERLEFTNKIRDKAIKEFAERLKEKDGVPMNTVDNTVKEMVGDE